MLTNIIVTTTNRYFEVVIKIYLFRQLIEENEGHILQEMVKLVAVQAA
jgi:hypothetical protein